MRRAWMMLVLGCVATVAVGCGSKDRAPDRDATQEHTGTSGRQAGEETVTGCLARGQMGIYMLTPEEALPREGGLGKGAATRGYQLLGDADDFNQYMNKRVRVTGTRAEEMQEPPDSNAPAAARDDRPEQAPWPKLQVREVDPIGGDCTPK
jgi:hypothetical protein